MHVLLQANVLNLGSIGELVKVKDGYARNYLFPRQLAILADKKNKKQFEHNLRSLEDKKRKALVEAQEQSILVNSISLTIQKLVGEEDRIFGTVTTQELVEAFKKEGYEFDRKNITVIDEIKKVGVYRGTVKLHPEVSAEFKIWVVAQS